MEKTIEQKIDENRIIFITSELNEKVTSDIIFNIMKWSEESIGNEINIYLSSSSRNFTNAIAIYDVLERIENPIRVFSLGHVGGFALLFLTIASKGNRFALKHTTFSFDQPLVLFQGGANQQTKVEIITNEASREREIVENILSERLNKSLEEIHNLFDEANQFNAEEALKFGLIDEILEYQDEQKKNHQSHRRSK